MLTKSDVKAASNDHTKAAAPSWPPEQLRAIAGSLPFDEIAEMALAFKTCQDLDDDAMELLAGIQLEGESLAAVEQLAYSAAIRRWYTTRFQTMQPRIMVLAGPHQ